MNHLSKELDFGRTSTHTWESQFKTLAVLGCWWPCLICWREMMPTCIFQFPDDKSWTIEVQGWYRIFNDICRFVNTENQEQHFESYAQTNMASYKYSGKHCKQDCKAMHKQIWLNLNIQENIASLQIGM